MIMLNYQAHGVLVAPQFVYKKQTHSLVRRFPLRLAISVACKHYSAVLSGINILVQDREHGQISAS